MATFSIGGVTANVSATGGLGSSTNTQQTVGVSVKGWLNSGAYVQSSGVYVVIKVDGHSSGKIKLFGDCYPSKFTGTSSNPANSGYSYEVTRGTSAKTVSWSADFYYYSDGVQIGSVKKTISGTVSVPAKPSYTVSYNANGGSGAPGSQTKWYGTNLTLSTTRPTRSGYNFKGWATSSGAATASVQPGATYSANAGATYYAVWELAYVNPAITSLDAYRAEADSTSSATGTYCYVSVAATKDSSTSLTVTASVDGGAATALTLSGSRYVKLLSGISADTNHTLTIKATDGNGKYATKSTTIPSKKYAMHFKKGGDGVAFGCASTKTNTAEFAYRVEANNGLYTNSLSIGNGAAFRSAIGAGTASESHNNTSGSGAGTGNAFRIGSMLICTARVEVPIPTANKVASKAVTWKNAFASNPYVLCSPTTSVPDKVTGVGVSNISPTGATVYVLRTNTTSTWVEVLAIGIAK